MEYYYEMDYDTLKEYIYATENIEILKDNAMKQKLIDSPRKYDFVWFIQDASLEVLKSLLDEVGIELLKNTSDVEYKLNGLLTSSKAKEYLFQFDSFCELVLKHFDEVDSYFYALENDGAITFCKYLMAHQSDKLEKFFLKLGSKAQVEVLKNVSFSLSTIKTFVVRGTKEAIEYILSNDLRFTTLTDFSFQELYTISTKGVKIPPHLLIKGDFKKEISTLHNVKNYRFLMENLEQENDISEIEEERKKYYDSEISSFIEEENMLACHYKWYQDICNCMDKDGDIISILDSFLISYYGNSKEEFDMRNRLITYYRNHDKKGLRIFLEQESRLQLTNMIIDYHFEQVPYNFFIDLKELIHFQEGEGKTLTEEEIELYSKLLIMDELPYQEVKRIHEELRKSSMRDIYYDQFRAAKDSANSLVQKAMLTSTSIQKYRDANLSRRAGVPIYVLEGEEFYAFVKSTHFDKSNVLQESSIFYGTDGGSYSLDGSSKLQTFKDPRMNYNFIYSSFPQNQVVHMFPVDSYSNYSRDENFKATHRIYELHTPEELVSRSGNYNEIILSLPNAHRNDELNDSLETPEIMGIYCYDTITDNDIISAQNLGVGIVLVKTKAYHIDTTNRLNMFETTSMGKKTEQNKYDYLEDISINDMASRRK